MSFVSRRHVGNGPVTVVRGLGGSTRTFQWPFNGALMVLDNGYLGYGSWGVYVGSLEFRVICRFNAN